MRKAILIISTIFLTLIFSNNLNAFRCANGTAVVTEGDSTTYVLSRCGEPALKVEVAIETIGSWRHSRFGGSYSETSMVVEKWTYNFGPYEFMEVCYIMGGEVVRLETGEKGFELEKKREKKRTYIKYLK